VRVGSTPSRTKPRPEPWGRSTLTAAAAGVGGDGRVIRRWVCVWLHLGTLLSERKSSIHGAAGGPVGPPLAAFAIARQSRRRKVVRPTRLALPRTAVLPQRSLGGRSRPSYFSDA